MRSGGIQRGRVQGAGCRSGWMVGSRPWVCRGLLCMRRSTCIVLGAADPSTQGPPGLWGLRPGRVLPSCCPSPARHSNRHRKWPHRAREHRAWGGDSWGHKPGTEVVGRLTEGTARLQARARLGAELGWWGRRARGVWVGRGGRSRTPVRPPRPAVPCLPSGPSAPLPIRRVTPTPSRSPSRGSLPALCVH